MKEKRGGRERRKTHTVARGMGFGEKCTNSNRTHRMALARSMQQHVASKHSEMGSFSHISSQKNDTLFYAFF